MFNAIGNGMGGLDWAGLDIWVAKLGIEDVDDLLDRLLQIRLYRPPKPNGDPS